METQKIVELRGAVKNWLTGNLKNAAADFITGALHNGLTPEKLLAVVGSVCNKMNPEEMDADCIAHNLTQSFPEFFPAEDELGTAAVLVDNWITPDEKPEALLLGRITRRGNGVYVSHLPLYIRKRLQSGGKISGHGVEFFATPREGGRWFYRAKLQPGYRWHCPRHQYPYPIKNSAETGEHYGVRVDFCTYNLQTAAAVVAVLLWRHGTFTTEAQIKKIRADGVKTGAGDGVEFFFN